MGEMAARGVGEDFPMIQYRQLSLFDVMPDAGVDSLIEQLPCRVAKSTIRTSKPKLSYFHWRITNIYDYADHPIDCLKGPHAKTGFVLRLYPKGWGIYNGAIQHVSKRNVFAMLDWLHEQQAKPLKNLFKKQEVLHDPNRSHNVGL